MTKVLHILQNQLGTTLVVVLHVLTDQIMLGTKPVREYKIIYHEHGHAMIHILVDSLVI
jgi:hypothetical protein